MSGPSALSRVVIFAVLGICALLDLCIALGALTTLRAAYVAIRISPLFAFADRRDLSLGSQVLAGLGPQSHEFLDEAEARVESLLALIRQIRSEHRIA